MENQPPIFFPFSPPPTSSSSSSLSLNMGMNNSDHHVYNENQSLNNKYSDGFLGLMAKMETPNLDNSNGSVFQNSGIDHEKKLGSKQKKDAKKMKTPRYAFQTKSQVDILDDGYRWRKYGQKAVKNNKFPRSYYRCTHQGCNVKKQVQRLTRDEGTVVTTYEGAHSHPIQKSTDNFEHILSQMQIYSPF